MRPPRVVRIGGHSSRYAGQIATTRVLSEIGSAIEVVSIEPRDVAAKWLERLIRVKDNVLRPLHPRVSGDVYFTDDSGFAILPLLAWLKGKPTVYLWWDDFVDIERARPRLPGPGLAGLLDYVKYHNYRTCTALVTVSDRTRAAARRIRSSDAGVFYIPTAVDTEHFDPARHDGAAIRARFGLGPDVVVVGYAGRVAGDPRTPEKFAGEPLVAAAPRILAEARRPVKFLVVGWGDRMPLLRARVAALGLDDAFVFAGYAPYHGDYGAHLAAFDVAVSTLDDVYVSYTRSETKLKELLAMGRAIVATGIGENVKDLDGGRAGLLCRPSNADLADRVLELVASPVRRAELGARARRRAREVYSLGALAPRWRAVFEWCTRGNSCSEDWGTRPWRAGGC